MDDARTGLRLGCPIRYSINFGAIVFILIHLDTVRYCRRSFRGLLGVLYPSLFCVCVFAVSMRLRWLTGEIVDEEIAWHVFAKFVCVCLDFLIFDLDTFSIPQTGESLAFLPWPWIFFRFDFSSVLISNIVSNHFSSEGLPDVLTEHWRRNVFIMDLCPVKELTELHSFRENPNFLEWIVSV